MASPNTTATTATTASDHGPPPPPIETDPGLEHLEIELVVSGATLTLKSDNPSFKLTATGWTYTLATTSTGVLVKVTWGRHLRIKVDKCRSEQAGVMKEWTEYQRYLQSHVLVPGEKVEYELWWAEGLGELKHHGGSGGILN